MRSAQHQEIQLFVSIASVCPKEALPDLRMVADRGIIWLRQQRGV